jgi:malic enzyme
MYVYTHTHTLSLSLSLSLSHTERERERERETLTHRHTQVNLAKRAGAQIQVGTSRAAQRLEERAVKNMLRPPVGVLALDSHDPYKGMVHNRQPPTRYDVTVTKA